MNAVASSGEVFISHASADDAFVAELRKALAAFRLPVWVDSRNLRGGDKLAPEIAKAIAQARHVLVVLGPQTVNSTWVPREIRKALEIERQRKSDGYRLIPLLLPGIQASALGTWFAEVPLAIPIELAPDGLREAMPKILAALGERLPAIPSRVPSPKRIRSRNWCCGSGSPESSSAATAPGASPPGRP